MPEIEDIKPSSILHKNWLVARATNPFLTSERAYRSLTFQKVEDQSTAGTAGSNMTALLGTAYAILGIIELGT